MSFFRPQSHRRRYIALLAAIIQLHALFFYFVIFHGMGPASGEKETGFSAPSSSPRARRGSFAPALTVAGVSCNPPAGAFERRGVPRSVVEALRMLAPASNTAGASTPAHAAGRWKISRA